eukprot:2081360-Alexandrium_andersonii.AAC.1
MAQSMHRASAQHVCAAAHQTSETGPRSTEQVRRHPLQSGHHSCTQNAWKLDGRDRRHCCIRHQYIAPRGASVSSDVLLLLASDASKQRCAQSCLRHARAHAP